MFVNNYIEPWTLSLSGAEYMLTLYSLVVAALALLVGFIRAIVTRNEVGARYRTTVVTAIATTGTLALSYAFLILNFVLCYQPHDGRFTPTARSALTFAPRFMEWSVSAPLLALQLLSVTALMGAAARRARVLTLGSVFLMIFFGFIGLFVFGGESQAQILIFAAIGLAFWVVANVVIVRSVRASRGILTEEAQRLLRGATAFFITSWIVYPLTYVAMIYLTGSVWATTMQVIFSATDALVVLGLCGLFHRIAKLRTAEDVRAGIDVHGESIWIMSVKLSDAGAANEVYLAAGAEIHRSRSRPPTSTAIATAVPEETSAHQDRDE